MTIRLDFEFGRLGPDKIALLEAVAQTGSFKATARAHKMSSGDVLRLLIVKRAPHPSRRESLARYFVRLNLQSS